jgi:hypothetical protein
MKYIITALLALLPLLSGCALTKSAFTNPTGIITVERQEFLDTYAKIKAIYLMAVDQVARGCQAGQFPEDFCLKAANVHQEAKALDLAVQAKIAVPESKLDWATIGTMVGLLAKLVL